LLIWLRHGTQKQTKTSKTKEIKSKQTTTNKRAAETATP
jgi:hypothetical protein